MSSQDEVSKEIKKKKRLIWLAMVLFGFCGVLGLLNQDITLSVIGFGFVVAGMISLRKFNQIDQNLVEYRPGQGFRFFRATKERRLREYTFAQFGIAAIMLVYLFYRSSTSSYTPLVIGVGGIFSIQYYLKKRIKLHTQIDTASLSELEVMGIITSQHFVKAIYKDFQSWDRIKKGNKILVVTQNSLICITMEDQFNAFRIESQLSSINRIGIIGSGRNGRGYLISIGTLDNRNIRLKLEGASSQDSPEEFISHFLRTLDEALTMSTPPPINQSLTRNAVQGEVKKNTNNNTASNNIPIPKLNIRQLDFFDNEPTNDNNTHQVPSNERFLDL